MDPREVLTDVREEVAARILVAVLFVIVKNWKQSKFYNRMWKLVWYLTRCSQVPKGAIVYDEYHVYCWHQSHASCKSSNIIP